jgi:RNA polymerase sigma-70 factor (ECF subfamily)
VSSAIFSVHTPAHPASPVGTSDADLAERVRAGDPAAFEAMFLAYYAQLVRFAFGFTKAEAEAEEIVQDVLTRIWERRHMLALREGGTLKAYLYTAVGNRSISWLRRQRQALAFEEQANADAGGVEGGQRPHDAQESLEAAELAERLQRAVNALPLRCRQVFTLHRAHGLSYRDIASALGITPKTVEIHMGRALRLLRQVIG